MAAETVTLTREKETLLITLYAKAQESRFPDSLLNDRFAVEAVRKLDYDFAKLSVRHDDKVALAMRAHRLDGFTREFIAGHPEPTILHLGCGLDSRVFRIDPPASVRWLDVDYPDVIALRRRVYPERAGTALIGSSVTDPQWIAEVPAHRPVLIVAEGLLPYLRQDDVLRLFERLTGHFRSGEIAFDGYSRLGLWLIRRNRMVKATGAALHWSIEDPRQLERHVPRLRLVADHFTYDRAALGRFSWPGRLAIQIFRVIPALRNVGRLLRYRFG